MTATQETNRATPLPYQEITVHTNTLDILANAKWEQKKYNLGDYFIVDVDAHHVETDSWAEILDYLTDPVLQDMAVEMQKGWPVTVAASAQSGSWPVRCRMSPAASRTRRRSPRRPLNDDIAHRDVTLMRRAIETWASTCRSCFRSRCWRSACIRRPRSDAADLPTTAGSPAASWRTRPRIKSMLGAAVRQPRGVPADDRRVRRQAAAWSAS